MTHTNQNLKQSCNETGELGTTFPKSPCFLQEVGEGGEKEEYSWWQSELALEWLPETGALGEPWNWCPPSRHTCATASNCPMLSYSCNGWASGRSEVEAGTEKNMHSLTVLYLPLSQMRGYFGAPPNSALGNHLDLPSEQAIPVDRKKSLLSWSRPEISLRIW